MAKAGVHIGDVYDLPRLEAGLAEFAAGLYEVSPVIRRDTGAARDWARAAVLRSRAELARAEEELRDAASRGSDEGDGYGVASDLRAAQRRVESAERAVEVAVRWDHRIDATAAQAELAADRLERLVTDEVDPARRSLVAQADDLFAYAGTAAGQPSPAPTGPAGRHPARTAAARVRAIRPLSAAGWPGATIGQRAAALQQAENEIAALQNRSPGTVALAEIDGWGSYEHATGTLTINRYMAERYRMLTLRTLAHESFHRNQHEVVARGRGDSRLEEWRDNMQPGSYVDPERDPRGYRLQPLERDAFAYEAEFAAGMTEGAA